jgi:ribose transport system substrate-binding protein
MGRKQKVADMDSFSIAPQSRSFAVSRPKVCFCFLIMGMAFVAGCGVKDSNQKFYLVSAQVQLPYWRAAGSGFLDAAKQLKLEAEFVGPQTYDPKAQQLDFERIVESKPGGILISVANAELMKVDIDAAVAAGIPVITMDADSPNSKRMAFIGTDNYLAGVMGAKVVAKELHLKGKVAVFTIPAMANLNDRLRGYREVFAAYPGIKITSIVDISGSPHVAFSAAERIITREREKVDAFVCLEAAGGKEVAEALDQHHVQGKIVVAMDTDDETLEWVKKGLIAATIAQKPYTMSYIGLAMLNNLHQHPPEPLEQNWKSNSFAPVPSFVDTGATLVDRNNVDAFIGAQKSANGSRLQ